MTREPGSAWRRPRTSSPKRLNDRTGLRLVAPDDGVVLPPPWVNEPEETDDQLPSGPPRRWNQRNLGAYLQESVPFCQVGDPEKMEASLVIDQSDIDFVEIDQKVEIKLDELPHDIFEGTIDDIAPEAHARSAPERLSTKSGGELAIADRRVGRGSAHEHSLPGQRRPRRPRRTLADRPPRPRQDPRPPPNPRHPTLATGHRDVQLQAVAGQRPHDSKARHARRPARRDCRSST